VSVSIQTGKEIRHGNNEVGKCFHLQARRAGHFACGSARHDGRHGIVGRRCQENAEGLPVTITAYGNQYTISSFTVGADKKGNTQIVCKGTGLNRIPMRNNQFIIPVLSLIRVGSAETETESITGLSEEGVTFLFGGKLVPNAVVSYPGDDRSKRTVVPVVR
jgi:hypothetical protein